MLKEPAAGAACKKGTLMELFGFALNVHVPRPVARLIWGVILVLIVLIVLVQHGAAVSFTIG